MDILSIESISIGALTPTLNAEARTALVEADVVIGVDRSSQREYTVFGTPPLEDSSTVKRPAAMRTVRVSLDYAAGELDELAALVQAIKGVQISRVAK